MKYLYALFLCLGFMAAHSQDYYYNGSEKVTVYKSSDAFISFEAPIDDITKQFKDVQVSSSNGFTVLEGKSLDFSINKLMSRNPDQITSALSLAPGGDFKMFPTKTVRVKLKPGVSKSSLTKFMSSNLVLSTVEKYGILRIQVKDVRDVLKLANDVYETGLAEFSLPDFYIPIELNQVNDPLFPLQFQMHNTGQVIDGVRGTNNIDVNALEAWGISLGNNVTVAVFDEGLENHEDFGNRLVGGFTAATNGNGAPATNLATHGMNCAGIIAASDDNIGLRGVAPNVNLLSVNIFAGNPTRGQIADGIRWAVNRGADVLSNSWSFPNAPCNFTDVDIDNAILDAATNGRNGRGAVVVFSAGNTGGCVEYPARNNNVISVGAIDNRGNLFNYSSRGPQLDLVAPSGETNYLGNVRTTDRTGAVGRLPGNYEDSFGGTSAACPVVAGVVALALSANPNLTQQQVRVLLTTTATDMGTAGFDNSFGFGRVNALAVVQRAAWRGAPQITIELQPVGLNYVNVRMVGANGTDINVQGITSTTWSKVSGGGSCTSFFSGSGRSGQANGNCNGWNMRVRITATNSFGTTTLLQSITPAPPSSCTNNFTISSTSNNIYGIQNAVIPCEGVSFTKAQVVSLQDYKSVEMIVYDFSGAKIAQSNSGQIDVSSLKSGLYIITGVVNGEVISLKIMR